jgi:hypothetical protein
MDLSVEELARAYIASHPSSYCMKSAPTPARSTPR